MTRRRFGWLSLGAAGMAVTLSAQVPTSTFEVASVKHAVPGTTGGRVQFLPGGRFVGQNVPLDFVLQQVYGVRDFQIIVAPEWRAIASSRYEIQAKGPESASTEQLKEMVKTLLAERFRLRLRKEMRNFPVYALAQAAGGVKGVHAPDGKGGGIELVANGWIRGRGVAVRALAETLSRSVDRPVIDRTNLVDQVIDFNLTWTPPEAVPPSEPGCHSSVQEMAKRVGYKLPESGCPSIFTAVQEQLGLRLEARQAPLEVLVIDSVQPLTEN